MPDNKVNPEIKLPDPKEVSAAMSKIAERSQKLVQDFLSRQASEPTFSMGDPMNVGAAFFEMTSRLMANPAKLIEAQMSLWADYMSLWQNTANRMMGGDAKAVIAPDKADKRFKDDSWQENEVFDFVKQSYLLTARCVQKLTNDVDGLDDKTAKKIDFYTKQFVDALAPSNFVLTNPEVLKKTVETGGENLLKGLNNLLGDIERGKGKLSISMTDLDAFKVGENIATTKGRVVYRNDLIELIQYNPTTEKVNATPFMIIPPWINKFYILDLKEKNSLIKWAVDQGHTTFVLSWVNPDDKLADKNFGDYMFDGPLAAVAEIEKITGQKKVNAMGYCLGGTLLATTLAYLAAKKEDKFASATFLTTMVDFKEPGELSVFIDEEQLTALEERMNKKGYLEGHEMAGTFNMLRANDLIWSFVVNNYLLGKEPFPFDLLYWNSDSTRMPAAMHSFYLRKMYQENKLVEPGGVEIKGVKIDLRNVKTPCYILSAREDHIAPWTSTYAANHIYSGPTRFVLSASGHIAGVVNPPAAKKYCYWLNDKKAKTPEEWFDGAAQHDGSWWTDWNQWVGKYAGEQVDARVTGQGLEAAPGSYVKVRFT